MLLVWGELQKEREQKEMTGRTGKSHGNFLFFFCSFTFALCNKQSLEEKGDIVFPFAV